MRARGNLLLLKRHDGLTMFAPRNGTKARPALEARARGALGLKASENWRGKGDSRRDGTNDDGRGNGLKRFERAAGSDNRRMFVHMDLKGCVLMDERFFVL